MLKTAIFMPTRRRNDIDMPCPVGDAKRAHVHTQCARTDTPTHLGRGVQDTKPIHHTLVSVAKRGSSDVGGSCARHQLHLWFDNNLR